MVGQEFDDWLGSQHSDLRAPIEIGLQVTERLVNEISRAQKAWGTREALLAKCELGGVLAEPLTRHAPSGLFDITDALYETTVMALMRATDHPKHNGSCSACRLTGILSNHSVVEVLQSKMWVTRARRDLPGQVAAWEITEQPTRIERFRAIVPLGWAKGDAPAQDGRLGKLRSDFRELRDKVLAHSEKFDIVQAPGRVLVLDGLRLCTEIAILASLIFLGHTSGLSTDFVDQAKKRDEVWAYFERGVLEYEADRRREFAADEAEVDVRK